MSEYVVTRTPTIMDGIVYRWYESEEAERAYGGGPVATASRNGVTAAIARRALTAQAHDVHDALRAGTDEHQHIVTHRRQSLFGDLVRVEADR